MYAIGRSEPSFVPGNKRYGLCSRAKALLACWEPILLQDVHCYQWLNTYPITLTYVPKQAGASSSLLFYPAFESHKFRVPQILKCH